MECILNKNEREELLLGYCNSTLELDTARTFERHIQTCQSCRELVETQSLLDHTMLEWKAPEPDPDFDRKLFAKIRLEQEQVHPWWKEYLTFQFGWKPLIPIAIASLALVLFLTRPVEIADSNRQAEAIRAEEIEQVERALDDIEALQALNQQEVAEGAKEKL